MAKMNEPKCRNIIIMVEALHGLVTYKNVVKTLNTIVKCFSADENLSSQVGGYPPRDNQGSIEKQVVCSQ